MADVDSSEWEISQAPDVSGRLDEIAAGVFVIHDERVPLVPNVGIIAGDRAALVIDPGLGPSNGETVRAAIAPVVGERTLFVTTTRLHPEHASGVPAFARGGRDGTAIVEGLSPRLRALHPDWDDEVMIAPAIACFAAAAAT